jgi:hypothetical protein
MRASEGGEGIGSAMLIFCFVFAEVNVFWLRDVAESRKIKVGPKKSDGTLELIDRKRLAIAKHAQVARSNKQQNSVVLPATVLLPRLHRR